MSPTETIPAAQPKEYVKLEWARRLVVVVGAGTFQALHGRLLCSYSFLFFIIIIFNFYTLLSLLDEIKDPFLDL